MKALEKLTTALERAGLSEYRVVNLTDERVGIMVYHDYLGLYPTVEAYDKHSAARRVARSFGFSAEKRGNVTATLIYPTAK